jgi:hypothetical protein
MKTFYKTQVTASLSLLLRATAEVGFKRPNKFYRDEQ